MARITIDLRFLSPFWLPPLLNFVFSASAATVFQWPTGEAAILIKGMSLGCGLIGSLYLILWAVLRLMDLKRGDKPSPLDDIFILRLPRPTSER